MFLCEHVELIPRLNLGVIFEPRTLSNRSVSGDPHSMKQSYPDDEIENKYYWFSWRSCRSSSVNFFLIFGREILREIWREFCGIFSDPQNKGSKISGKTSEHFS